MSSAFVLKLLALLKFSFLAADGRTRPTWRAIIFVPLFSLIALAIVIVTTGVLGPDVVTREFSLQLIVQGVAMLGASMGAAWILLRVLDNRSFRTLGLWTFRGWAKELALGVAFGAGLNTLIVLALMSAGSIEFRWAGVGFGEATLGLLWGLLILSPASAGEETLFRGYLFQRLVDGWGGWGTVVFTSFIFGWGHYNNPNATLLAAANTGLAGALLAVMYLKTRALWMPIGAHISWNYVMGAVYSLPVSGLNMEGRLFEVEISGPEWFSGGAFGPEGSVLVTAVLVGATLWIAVSKRFVISPEQRKALEGHPTERVES